MHGYVEGATEKSGKPGVMNTVYGSQFTPEAFTGLIKNNGIKIGMGGKGVWRDNVFVERRWRSVKYEEIYLHAYDFFAEARQGLNRYLRF
jgi:putative transposase